MSEPTKPQQQQALSLRERQMKRVSECLDQEERELTAWEESFLKSVHKQMDGQWKELSEKQLAVVENIEDIIKNGRNKAK